MHVKSRLFLAIRAALVCAFAPSSLYALPQSGAATPAATASQAAATIGVVRGKVLSNATGAPVAGAQLRIAGSQLSTTSDANGEFVWELPAGVHAVLIEAEGYETAAIEALQVTAGAQSVEQFALEPERKSAATPPPDASEAKDVGEVEVRGARVEQGSQQLVTEERRVAAQVLEVIGAEQIARAGDTDAGAALKRVTGLSLVDNKFIYVRGLGERYSAVQFNGAQIPSPDPFRRVIPMDLFPTDILDSVQVQKTLSASVPGEFGGGAVQLRTRGVPDKAFFRIASAVGAQEGTTFERSLRYSGSGRDWTGYDSGIRDMPGDLAQATAGRRFLRERSPVFQQGFTPEQIQQFGRSLGERGYDTFSRRVGPDTGIGLAGGNRLERGEWKFGFLSSLRYSQSWNDQDEFRASYQFTNQGLVRLDDQQVERTLRNIDLSGFLTLGAQYGNDHRLTGTLALLRVTEDEVRQATGIDDNQFTRRSRLEWVENELLVRQLTGEHILSGLNGLTLNWNYTDSEASRYSPNERNYRYDFDDVADVFLFSARADGNLQRFALLDDRVKDLILSAKYPWTVGDNWYGDVQLGGSRTRRDRQNDVRSFSFIPAPGFNLPLSLLANPNPSRIFTRDNIRPNGFRLFEATAATDNYFASQDLDALYLEADINYQAIWRFTLGLRREDNLQTVTTFSIENPQAPPVRAVIDEADTLPSLAVTWLYSDTDQLRFSLGRTISRPDFRELSPAAFLDPLLDQNFVGNPNLRTTRIDAADLRWERYFGDADVLSVALFYKRFEDPIEQVRFQGSGVVSGFANAESAKSFGIEFDAYRRIGFLGEYAWIERWVPEHLTLDNFYVSANYSRIRSDISLDPIAAAFNTNLNRPMQGQSPYVSNFQFGYIAPEEAREFSILFNRFGRRISEIGVQGAPDIYEEAYTSMDFVFRQKLLEGVSLRFRARNLLDPEVKFSQGRELTRLYKRGRDFNLSIDWRF